MSSIFPYRLFTTAKSVWIVSLVHLQLTEYQESPEGILDYHGFCESTISMPIFISLLMLVVNLPEGSRGYLMDIPQKLVLFYHIDHLL